MKIETTCAYCALAFMIEKGALNRANKRNASVYCGRVCSGLGRRKWKSPEENKADKAAYDAEYRRRNRAMLKRKKAEYFRRTYDPEQAAVERKKRAKAHAEYCRSPEYKKWKKQYDRKYRAKKLYGEFWECFLLSQDIREYCLNVMSDYEIRLGKGTLNKSQKRKRDYERTVSNEPQIGALGNPERR